MSMFSKYVVVCLAALALLSSGNAHYCSMSLDRVFITRPASHCFYSATKARLRRGLDLFRVVRCGTDFRNVCDN